MPAFFFESGNAPLASNVGALLLDLRNALQQAERCRLALKTLGFSQARWQEIVRDVDPDLRFALRPQVLDAIIMYLQSVGQPVHRQELVRTLNAQGAGIPQRIKQSITQNLRSGYLMLYPGNKIGLPDWKKIAELGESG
ncbi:MAG TPA: hypothetical protein VH024_04410 [Candidatus Angelobacter sp.]|jgi:hypothetical protein|nr:hypothetical protein [Candidatus Angelobacter sp.]